MLVIAAMNHNIGLQLVILKLEMLQNKNIITKLYLLFTKRAIIDSYCCNKGIKKM